MKRLLLGCEEEVSWTFSDITGDWTFTGENVSGEFRIVKTLDGEYSTVEGTEFFVEGITYTNTNQQTLSITGLSIGPIVFIESL